MAKRLIIDSCTHLIEAYGVDGFRFDLAELLGVDVLKEVEAALKKVKPGVILIAEPWSFRGHIAGALRDTGWASWNDGYRNFLKDYVHGRRPPSGWSTSCAARPGISPSGPPRRSTTPSRTTTGRGSTQITENPGGDGTNPTGNDVRRTHLMAAILFMSVGIPMLAEGQDFLRSQGRLGQHLPARRRERPRLQANVPEPGHPRLLRGLDLLPAGPRGRLLRHFSRPSEGFFQFFNPAARRWRCL
jgi:pullulanase